MKYRIITWLIVVYGAITGARCECEPAQIQAPELSEITINNLARFSKEARFMTTDGDSMLLKYREMNVNPAQVDDCRRNYGACMCYSGSSASSHGILSFQGKQVAVSASSELFQEFDVLGPQNSWLSIGSQTTRSVGDWALENFMDMNYIGQFSNDSLQLESMYIWTDLDTNRLYPPFDFDTIFLDANQGIVGFSTLSDSINFWISP